MYTDKEINPIAKEVLRNVIHDIDREIEWALDKRFPGARYHSSTWYRDRFEARQREIFDVCIESLKEELFKLATKSYIKAIEQEDDLE